MVTRADIIKQARTYIDTPFLHQARVRAIGMDCVGLVLTVGEDLGLVDTKGRPFKRDQYPFYSAQPQGMLVHNECVARLVQKLDRRKMEPGDIVTMRMPVDPTHTGILSSNSGALYIIHAYDGGATKVTEHILDDKWKRRIFGVFSFPGIA